MADTVINIESIDILKNRRTTLTIDGATRIYLTAIKRVRKYDDLPEVLRFLIDLYISGCGEREHTKFNVEVMKETRHKLGMIVKQDDFPKERLDEAQKLAESIVAEQDRLEGIYRTVPLDKHDIVVDIEALHRITEKIDEGSVVQQEVQQEIQQQMESDDILTLSDEDLSEAAPFEHDPLLDKLGSEHKAVAQKPADDKLNEPKEINLDDLSDEPDTTVNKKKRRSDKTDDLPF